MAGGAESAGEDEPGFASPAAWADLAGPEPRNLRVRAGDAFPNLVLPSVEGRREMSVEQYRGRPLLLHFFASW
jgi:hypothetical protein